MALLGNKSYLFISDSQQSLVTKIALGNSDGSATELYATDYTYQLKQVGTMRKSGFNYPVEIRNSTTGLTAYKTGSNFTRKGKGYGDVGGYGFSDINVNEWIAIQDTITGYRVINDSDNLWFTSYAQVVLNDNNEIFSCPDRYSYVVRKTTGNTYKDYSVSSRAQDTRMTANTTDLYYVYVDGDLYNLNLVSGQTTKIGNIGFYPSYLKVSNDGDLYVLKDKDVYIFKNGSLTKVFTSTNNVRQLTFEDNYTHVITTANEIYDTVKIYKK